MLQSLLAGNQTDFECSGCCNIPNAANRETLVLSNVYPGQKTRERMSQESPHSCGHVLVPRTSWHASVINSKAFTAGTTEWLSPCFPWVVKDMQWYFAVQRFNLFYSFPQAKHRVCAGCNSIIGVPHMTDCILSAASCLSNVKHSRHPTDRQASSQHHDNDKFLA